MAYKVPLESAVHHILMGSRFTGERTRRLQNLASMEPGAISLEQQGDKVIGLFVSGALSKR